LKKTLVLTLVIALILCWSALTAAADLEVDYWHVNVDGATLPLGYINLDGGQEPIGKLIDLKVDSSNSFKLEGRYKGFILGYSAVSTDGTTNWDATNGENLAYTILHPDWDDDIYGVRAKMDLDLNALDFGTSLDVIKNDKSTVTVEGLLRSGSLKRSYSVNYIYDSEYPDASSSKAGTRYPGEDYGAYRIDSKVKQNFIGPMLGVRTSYQLGKLNLYARARYGIMFSDTDANYSLNDVDIDNNGNVTDGPYDTMVDTKRSTNESFNVHELELGATYPVAKSVSLSAGWFSSCYSGVLNEPKFPDDVGYGVTTWEKSDLVTSGFKLGVVWKF
jgi:hypothetical protein